MHLVISLAHGGLERLVLDWTNERNRRQAGSTSVCCLDEKGALAELANCDVFCLNARRERFPFDLPAALQLRRLIRRSGTQILHSHNLAAHQYGVLACAGTGVHHVHTRHGTDLHLKGPLNKLRSVALSRLTDEIVAVSHATACALKENGSRIGEVRVIPNGVSPHPDYKPADIAALRAKLRIEPETFVIGSIGRLAHVKGYDRLLRAFAELSAKSDKPEDRIQDSVISGLPAVALLSDVASAKLEEEAGLSSVVRRPSLAAPELPDGGGSVVCGQVSGLRSQVLSLPTHRHADTPTLLLVGDGPERANLEREAEKLGIGESVLFAGFQQEPRMFLNLMSLFVLPSRSEGLSVALLEAMAAGVPVAATDVGANREVVDNGECGILLSDDETQWAQMISRETAETFARHARVGVDRTGMLYSYDVTIRSYEHVYSSVCAR